jgi:hypothetical protein
MPSYDSGTGIFANGSNMRGTGSKYFSMSVP